MRPSFHCAMAWPFSAAYSSEFTALTVSPVLSQFAPERNASVGVIGGGPTLPSVLLPSSASTGAAAVRLAPMSSTPNRLSTVRIALFLSSTAGMRYCAVHSRTNLLRVFPQVTGSEFALARRPLALALGDLARRKLDVEGTLHSIDLDGVTVAEQADRAADCGFWTDMPNAETARCARETSVGNQRDLLTRTLAVKSGRGSQHFAHARPAARPLVADHQHFAVSVFAGFDRVKAGFLAIEAARRAAELQRLHAGDFHDRAVGCEITFEPDHATRRQQWLIGRTHDILIRIPFHVFQIFGDRAPGHRQATAVQISVIEKCFHQKWHATSLEHILGDITATWFQICDIRSLFEDFGDVEELELYTAFMCDRRQM